MKNLIIISSLLMSSLSWSCADLAKKPKWMGQNKIECGKLLHSIEQPTMTINGRTLPYAVVLNDDHGTCPDKKAGCFRPWENIVARGNAVCKAYGFGKFGKHTGYTSLKKHPTEFAALVRDTSGKLRPQIVKVNPKRSEYSWVRSIWCNPDYSKR